MSLKRNLHNFDRLVRLALGVGCTYIGFIDTSLIGNDLVAIPVGIFGVINIFAFFTAHCPVYAATGFSTHRCARD